MNTEVPEHVPDDRLVDLGRDRLDLPGLVFREQAEQAAAQPRPLQEQQQHQDEDREQLEQQ
jgi:hypothetical protein